MSSRCDLLTSVLVDRAYSGKTGNKADVLLGNLFGLNTRVGLADKIHCCTTAANVVWSDKRRNAQGKAKSKSKHLGGSAQSGRAAGSAEAGCEEVAVPISSSSSDESFGSSNSSSSETANIRGIVKAHTIRVPLSVGPGFAGSSGPLNVMMGYQASLQASPNTWQVQDESVTRVRKSMGKWADLCKSMAKFFGRGINRTFLAMAYHEHEKALRQGGEQGLGGVQGCPEEVASCSGHGPVVA